MLKNKKILAIVVIMILLLSASLIFFINQPPTWKSYPMTIDNTDITFPEACGFHGEHIEYWSVGLTLKDGSGNEYYIILLYNMCSLIGSKSYIFIDKTNDRVASGNEGINYGPLRALVSSDDQLNISFRNNNNEYDSFKETGTPFKYQLDSYLGGDVLNVTLDAKKPPVTVFDGQVSNNSSYYFFFALTNCEVNGQITIDGNSVNVNGIGWFERQWGDFNWKWEWWSGQIDNNNEIEIVSLYENNNNTPVKEYILFVDEQGISITTTDVSITTTNYQDRDYGTYPSEWIVTSDELELNLTLETREIYDLDGFAISVISGQGTIGNQEVTFELYGEFLVDY